MNLAVIVKVEDRNVLQMFCLAWNT